MTQGYVSLGHPVVISVTKALGLQAVAVRTERAKQKKANLKAE